MVACSRINVLVLFGISPEDTTPIEREPHGSTNQEVIIEEEHARDNSDSP